MNSNAIAVILAAGKSSRFEPYCHDDAPKCLIEIMGKPIIEHTLLSVKKAGIKDVIIVISKNSKVREVVGDGKKLDINITYAIQPEALGMGEALLFAEKYIKSDFFLLHAHRIDFFKFKNLLEKSKKEDNEIVLLAKRIRNPLVLQKIGVLKVKEDKVLEIVEKPAIGNQPSDLGIVGVYLLNKRFIDALREVPKEHYSFEKAISIFTKKQPVKFVLTAEDTISLKYSWDLLQLKDWLLKGLGSYISQKASISSTAQISGTVYIEDDARIMENSSIKGPCYIGKNVLIGNNVVIRNGVDVEKDCMIGAFAEVKNTFIMRGSKIHSGFIGDSIIGENCRVGAQFTTANKRINRETIKVKINGKKIDTGLGSLGTIIGNDVKVGIKSSTMPGIIINKGATIGPATVVLKSVESGTKYYTKFQEIVEK